MIIAQQWNKGNIHIAVGHQQNNGNNNRQVNQELRGTNTPPITVLRVNLYMLLLVLPHQPPLTKQLLNPLRRGAGGVTMVHLVTVFQSGGTQYVQ